jgi:WhiB family redox-sensing transcriptional regulator
MSGLPDVSALPGPNADLWDWQLDARCRELPTAVFFHPWGERGDRRHRREAEAKQICRTCPVIDECARHALAAREQYGVWGGMGEDERRAMLRGTGPRGRRPQAELAGAGSAGGFGSDSAG